MRYKMKRQTYKYNASAFVSAGSVNAGRELRTWYTDEGCWNCEPAASVNGLHKRARRAAGAAGLLNAVNRVASHKGNH